MSSGDRTCHPRLYASVWARRVHFRPAEGSGLTTSFGVPLKCKV
jgi:hypothetical protein